MQQDIEQRVIQVIAATQHMPVESIQPASTFEELKIDSLDGINIVFALENEFDISIPDEAAKSIRGVPDIVDGIARLLEKKAEEAARPEPA
jgi:acyl carrier protein